MLFKAFSTNQDKVKCRTAVNTIMTAGSEYDVVIDDLMPCLSKRCTDALMFRS